MSRISTRGNTPCGQFTSKKAAQAYCNERKEHGERWKPVNVGETNPGFDRDGKERQPQPWGVLKVNT